MIRQKIEEHIYILIGFVTLLFFFNQLIFSERTLTLRDIHLYYYPMKSFLANPYYPLFFRTCLVISAITFCAAMLIGFFINRKPRRPEQDDEQALDEICFRKK